MNKIKRFLIVVVSVVIALLFVNNLVAPAQADKDNISTPSVSGTPYPKMENLEIVDSKVPEGMKDTIQAYFEIRYQLLSVSPPADIQQDVFGKLVSSRDDAKDFLTTETAKLAVERKWYELNKLRYAKYEYSLKYTDISFDATAQMATVSLHEYFEIICEKTMDNNSQNPSACAIGELTHEIVLHNENNQWKIISDTYWDSWWRQFRKPGLSTNEILQNINAKETSVTAHVNSLLPIAAPETEFSCNLSADDSSHPYERNDAVTYAQTHALPENYNLYYPSYDDQTYGDCTNFVSQAVYEDGNASMSIPEPLPARTTDGQLQWYLLNGMQRASAWNHVVPLYDFLVSPAVWNEGPEGCEMTYDNDEQLAERLSQIQAGDIIQYDWDGIGGWDHSVIVVGSDENGIVQVASHSPNSQQLAYNWTAYENIRLIHIERSDGMPPVKTFIAVAGDDENTRDCDGDFLGNEVYLGKCDDGESIISGFRFTDIQIPYGATIKYAYITFSVDGTYTSPISLKIYGDASGNSESFSTSNPLAARPTTSASSAVTWDVTEQWDLTKNLAGGESQFSFTTPQLASVLQEIVNQDGWVSGNSLSIIIKDNGSTTHRRVIAWERA
ncbi:MAG: amidase domain-containing protein, partial [Anaerolineales bacterium]|nr:amidase domain-containing protein [Anaerolineales bacterium]